MQLANESNRTQALQRGFTAVVLPLLFALASLIVSPGATLAQDPPPPTYPDPLTSLPDAEAVSFSHWALNTTLVVPTTALQAAINAQAGGGFVALSTAPGSGLSMVNMVALNDRITHLTTSGETSGPLASLTVVAAVLNTNVSPPRVELGILLALNSNADRSNLLLGKDATAQGKFEWEIEQEEGMQVLRVEIKGPRGFRTTLESTIAQGLGFRVVNDPNRLVPTDPSTPIATFRFLTDGVGGVHPTFQLASQFDLIPVAPGMFRGLAAGRTFSLPGGVLPILEVPPGFVFRSYEDHLDRL
jgi:hypothetical protein